MILFPMLQFLLQVSLININLVKFCDNDFRFDVSCAVCGHDIETTFIIYRPGARGIRRNITLSVDISRGAKYYAPVSGMPRTPLPGECRGIAGNY